MVGRRHLLFLSGFALIGITEADRFACFALSEMPNTSQRSHHETLAAFEVLQSRTLASQSPHHDR